MLSGEAMRAPDPERPLAGKGIVVTRAAAQAGDLVRRLEQAGARTLVFPTIALAPPSDPAALQRALDRIETYAWILFTSANAVAAVLDRLAAAGRRPAALRGARLAAIGPITAAALAEHGLSVEVVPDAYRAEGLLAALPPQDWAGVRVLLPRAAAARDLLPQGLERLGARVDVVEAYRTVLPPADVDGLRRAVDRGEVQAITFTSSSTVRHFAELLGGPGAATSMLAAAGVQVACIGPITADTARALGFDVRVEAAEFTMEGLVGALARHFAA